MSVVALLLAGCGSGSTISRVQTTTVVFRVGAGASSANRDRTAQLMQARFRALGARGSIVRADGDRLVVTGPDSVRRIAPRVAGRGLIEFRPVLALVPRGVSVEGATPDSVLPSRDPAAPRYHVGPAAVTGGVKSARALDVGGLDGWAVDFSFTRAAMADFNRLAADLFPKPPPENSVAIVTDGILQSAPAFRTTHLSGSVQVTGNFSHAEADALVAALRTGPYPVEVELV